MLEDLSRQHPDNALVYPWLAQGYLSTDRVAEGRTALDTALRLKVPSSNLVPVILAYAHYYETKGDFEEAEKLYQSAGALGDAQEISEGKGRLYLSWAEDDLNKQKLNDAVKHLEAAGSFASELDEPLRSMIPHRLAECYRQLAGLAETRDKNDEEAVRLLEKSIQATDEPATRMILAGIYARQGKVNEAISNYQSVTAVDSNNLEARHHLIDLLISQKDYEKAQTALTELTEREKSLENFQLVTLVNLKLKNYAGAVRALEDAIELGEKPELLKQLESVLLDWSALLTREKKVQEAIMVKGRADRVAEQLGMLTNKEQDKQKDEPETSVTAESKPDEYWEKNPPIALSSSRTWLAKGTLTPEGQISIRNISGRPVSDLTLSAVFFDNTAKKANGSVTLPVATPTSPPFETGGSRTLYFSCPNIVKPDHRLAVIILWKGRFLKEFPVVKQM